MSDYPPEWKSGRVQFYIRWMAGHRCEHCGMKFRLNSNIAVDAKNADGKPTIGTVHHLNGNRSDCDWRNLVYVCQKCHLHIQAVWQPGGTLPSVWAVPPRWLVARGLPFVANPHRRLF